MAECRAAFEQGQRGVARPCRIVLVSDRGAKDCEHGITDELLHEATVARDGPGHCVEQRALEGADYFGIEPFGERSEPGEVSEEDGHLTPVSLSTGTVRGHPCR